MQNTSQSAQVATADTDQPPFGRFVVCACCNTGIWGKSVNVPVLGVHA